MRGSRGYNRLCLVLIVLGALPGACSPDLPRDTGEESPWNAAAWRRRLHAHAESTERMLPVLSAAARADDPGVYRDTLRTIYASLQTAEDSVPPILWGIDLADAELHSKYRSALRELRYGAEVMLKGLAPGQEERRDEARYFIVRGVRLFQEVRDAMERASQVPASDTSIGTEHPSAADGYG